MAKEFKLVFVLVFVLAFSGAHSLFWNLLGSSTSQQSRLCVINANTTNCGANSTRICGRLGSSNLCVRFQNICTFRASNCVSRIQYTRVALSQCSGISLNQRGSCASSSGVSIINLR